MSTDAARPVRAEQFDTAEQQTVAATFGMWVFLATELLFFGPLFFGYAYVRTHFPEAFAAASRHTYVMFGTVNTGILLTSSLTMAVAIEARKLGSVRLAKWMLWITAALGLAFIALKGTEYLLEWREHLFPDAGFSFAAPYTSGAELFFFLYFAMTGLHAVHLLIGVTAVSVFATALTRNAGRFANGERIEILGLYWHFIDSVWIFLYPMLYLVGRSSG